MPLKAYCLRNSVNQYVKPTRRTTNPLLISKTSSDPSNQVSAVVADSGALSGYVNLPPAWSAGPIFALRLVYWLSDNHCAVWLFESYPQRRIWANFYNIDVWSGWEQV